MKNVIKLMAALKQAFPAHKVDNRVIDDNFNMECIFIDDKCVGHFYEDFLQEDFDNPEIEIKIKAPLKNIEWFIKDASSYGIIRGAVERGFEEWREGSQQNN